MMSPLAVLLLDISPVHSGRHFGNLKQQNLSLPLGCRGLLLWLYRTWHESRCRLRNNSLEWTQIVPPNPWYVFIFCYNMSKSQIILYPLPRIITSIWNVSTPKTPYGNFSHIWCCLQRSIFHMDVQYFQNQPIWFCLGTPCFGSFCLALPCFALPVFVIIDNSYMFNLIWIAT